MLRYHILQEGQCELEGMETQRERTTKREGRDGKRRSDEDNEKDTCEGEKEDFGDQHCMSARVRTMRIQQVGKREGAMIRGHLPAKLV